MKKIDFQTLLTDLYLLYNPRKVNDVNFLMEKYTGQEYDAVQMFYIKYNQKNHAFFNPNVTEEFILELIESYNNKDRVLSPENIAQAQAQVKVPEIDQVELDRKAIEEKAAELKLLTAEKEAEKKKLTEEIEKNLLEKISQDVEKTKEVNPLKGFEINVSNYYQESEVVLPDPMILLYMGIGSKFICRNKDRKIIPLCVQDITMDFVTDVKNPVIEIIINEARLND